MAAYKLAVQVSAAKEIEHLKSLADRRRVVARIRSLTTEARLATSEKLAGHDDRYRARVGNLRVVYLVDDSKGAVTIYKIGARRKVYR